MLYPAELRDQALRMACLALVLKTGAAFGAHPCSPGKAVDPGTAEIVAVGVAWPRGERASTGPVERLHPTQRKPDRYERLLGFPFAPGAAEPLQIEWLRDGLAFADPGGLAEPCRAALVEAEAEARRFGRGLWARRRIERAADPSLAKRVDRFAVVEGRIVSVGDRTRRLYLNFGTFWGQDFTVQIDKRDLKRHPELLARLGRAKGRTVRVRGRLSLRNGPFMRVRDAGQIEFQDDLPPAGAGAPLPRR